MSRLFKSFLSLLFNIYDYTDKKRTYLFLFVVIFIAQKSHSLYALVIPCLSPFVCSRGKWRFTLFLLKDGFHIPYLEKNQRIKLTERREGIPFGHRHPCLYSLMFNLYLMICSPSSPPHA